MYVVYKYQGLSSCKKASKRILHKVHCKLHILGTFKCICLWQLELLHFKQQILKQNHFFYWEERGSGKIFIIWLELESYRVSTCNLCSVLMWHGNDLNYTDLAIIVLMGNTSSTFFATVKYSLVSSPKGKEAFQVTSGTLFVVLKWNDRIKLHIHSFLHCINSSWNKGWNFKGTVFYALFNGGWYGEGDMCIVEFLPDRDLVEKNWIWCMTFVQRVLIMTVEFTITNYCGY